MIQEAGSAASRPAGSRSWCRRWAFGHLQEPSLEAVQGHRRAGQCLPGAADRGEWPYLWLDATYLKVRDGGRIVSVAAIIAVAVNTEGRREIVGLRIGPSEAEPFWSAFLKGLVKRGLRGVKLVISDAHDGLRHAITRVLGATWQRCRVHWIRNALAHVPKGQHTMVAAAIRQAFLQADAEAAHQTWRHVADQL